MLKESYLSLFIKEHINQVIDHHGKEPTFADPEVQKFEDKFVKLTFLMEKDEQEEFIKSYLKHVVGVDSQNPDWADQAGKNLNGVGELMPNNGITFWQEVNYKIPGLFTKEEKEWLIQNDPRASGALYLIQFMSFWVPRSRLVIKLTNSIHFWK